MLTLRAPALFLIAALLAGCSSLNPFNWFGSDNRPKMARLPELKNTIAVRILWQARVGPSKEAVLSPVLAAASVFAAGSDGTVVRLEADTGRPLWRVNAGQPLSGGVGANESVVAVGTAEGEVIALDAESGNVRWRSRVSSEVLAAPAVSGDLVIVRCSDSRVFALDARDGRRRPLPCAAPPA
jgi:outer membrane protein assembly factor BamB